MPAWTPDGQEIFYRGSGAMFSVKLTKTSSGGLEASPPQPLFPIADPQVLPFYSISDDGQRLIFVRATGSSRVSLLPNWTAHVDR